MPRKTLPRTHIVQAFSKQRDLLSSTVAFFVVVVVEHRVTKSERLKNKTTLHYITHLT